jgi:hypothetical protein
MKTAKVTLPVIRALLAARMAGKPLSDLERAIGTQEKAIKTCETARHFAVRSLLILHSWRASLPGSSRRRRLRPAKNLAHRSRLPP